METPEDHSQRSKSFLALCRQIQQVATDYDILADTADILQETNQWYEKEVFESGLKENLEQETRQFMKDAFARYPNQVRLLRTYSSLYSSRTQIGVSESFAMVNQRDSEVHISCLGTSPFLASTAL